MRYENNLNCLWGIYHSVHIRLECYDKVGILLQSNLIENQNLVIIMNLLILYLFCFTVLKLHIYLLIRRLKFVFYRGLNLSEYIRIC